MFTVIKINLLHFKVNYFDKGNQVLVKELLGELARMPGLRLAEAGEFTRRAFDNGKLDLTQVEGLADVLAAQTERQLALALKQYEGHAARELASWANTLT